MNNANSPAMPLSDNITFGNEGLTKREMMAMHITNGLIAGGHLRARDAKQLPELAVVLTDALLAELDRTR